MTGRPSKCAHSVTQIDENGVPYCGQCGAVDPDGRLDHHEGRERDETRVTNGNAWSQTRKIRGPMPTQTAADFGRYSSICPYPPLARKMRVGGRPFPVSLAGKVGGGEL